MPIEARRLMVLLCLGYLVSAFGLGYIQFVRQDALASDPRNPRLAMAQPATSRGGILARGGEVITTGPGPMARVYSIPSLCHTVGYTDPRFGASGLEAVYDRALAGRDARSAWSVWLAEVRGRQGRGADLATTIDLRLQNAAWHALGPRPGSVVVLDAVTGDVLALVSQPGFRNPPTVKSWVQDRVRTDGPFLNRGLLGLYPPGSSFKIVIAAAALQSRLDGFAVDCGGRTMVAGRQLKDANGAGHGSIGLERALTVSCNIYFIKLAARLGAQALVHQARSFGLGSAPPCDLGAAAGSIPAPVNEVELAEAAIGQGRLLVSPMQMALVAAAVVNEGRIMRPRLVRAIRYQTGAEETKPRVWRQALGPEGAEELRHDLEQAVRLGTGSRAAVAGFAVGGKTGTAQVPGGRPHAWFVGFAHAGQRRLAIAVVVEHAGGGGAIAAPIAAAVWRAAAGGAIN